MVPMITTLVLTVASAFANSWVRAALSVLQLVNVLGLFTFLWLWLVKPLMEIDARLMVITRMVQCDRGDLSDRLAVRRRKDELGRLVKGINLLLERLQYTMQDIHDQAVSLEDSNENIIEKAGSSEASSRSMSSMTDEINDGIVVMSGKLSDMSTDVERLNDGTEEMHNAAVSGREYANEMRARADGMKDLARTSKDGSRKLTSSLRSELESSAKNSKSIDSIKKLTQEILDVSGRINTLSLNASLEAARTGSSGLGFVNVAHEIRELSDNSRSIANDIQMLSEDVVESVNNLTDFSSQLLGYMDNDLQADFDKIFDAFRAYSRDADRMEDMMHDFGEKSDRLSKTSSRVNHGMSDISRVLDDESSMMASMNDMMQSMNDDLHEIQRCTDTNDRVSEELKAEIKKYRAI